jgi:hypothetical protein
VLPLHNGPTAIEIITFRYATGNNRKVCQPGSSRFEAGHYDSIILLYKTLRFQRYIIYTIYAVVYIAELCLTRIKQELAPQTPGLTKGEKCRTSYFQGRPRMSSASSSSRQNRKKPPNAIRKIPRIENK